MNEELKERSLVVFTILAQLAIGAFYISGLIHVWVSLRTNAETARSLTNPVFLGIIPIMAAALLLSLLHLGTPLNAWRSVANLRTSWLSREILFTLLFTLVEAVFALLQWQPIGPGWLRTLLWLAAAITGGLALYSMCRLYMLRTIPSWNTWMTPVTFIASALLLGSLAAGMGLTLNPTARGDLLRLPLVWISALSLFLLSAQVVLSALRRASGWQAQSTALLITQTSLLAFTLSISSMLLYQSALFEFSGRSPALSLLVSLAFMGALAEAALARLLFYLSFERVGV